jgi:hypothetical protein
VVPLAQNSLALDRHVPNPKKHDFSLKLTRVIGPKAGPCVELATLPPLRGTDIAMRPVGVPVLDLVDAAKLDSAPPKPRQGPHRSSVRAGVS